MNLLRKGVVSAFLTGIFWLVFVTSAPAAIVYGDYSGTTLDFLNITEDSSTDSLPLFGTPMVIGSQSLFFPTTFESKSSDGSSDITAGVLTMTLRAAEGFTISTVSITEIGSYSLTGLGSADTWASIGGTLELGTQSDALDFNPSNPYALPGDSSGLFQGSTLLDFSGLGITEVSFSLTNILETQSEAGTTAWIGKSLISGGVELEINTSPIPLPGAVWLLGSGLIAMLGLRKRSKKI